MQKLLACGCVRDLISLSNCKMSPVPLSAPFDKTVKFVSHSQHVAVNTMCTIRCVIVCIACLLSIQSIEVND